MTPKEYWSTLEIEIAAFERSHNQPSEDKIDEKEYQKQKNTLLQVAQLALIANDAWSPLTQKDCVTKIDALVNNKETFGENGYPVVIGKKTRDFIELVYIPHLKRQKQVILGNQAVIFNTILKALGSKETIQDRIIFSQQKAEKLAHSIQTFDAEQQKVSLGLFNPKQELAPVENHKIQESPTLSPK